MRQWVPLVLLSAAGLCAGCCSGDTLARPGWTFSYTKPPTMLAPAVVTTQPGATAVSGIGTMGGGVVGSTTATALAPAAVSVDNVPAPAPLPAPRLRIAAPDEARLPMPRGLAGPQDPCENLQDICRRLDEIRRRLDAKGKEE